MSSYEIGYNLGYPNNQLSNLYPRPFTFYLDGYESSKCGSIEGFLHGLKYRDIDTQKRVFMLSEYEANKAGKEINWRRDQTLFYNGMAVNRHSELYQDMLDAAYFHMALQNIDFMRSLEKTKGKELLHSIGSNDSFVTVLTIDEFIGRLNFMREIAERYI
ncbi:hypothetical protein POP12_246 [Pectobacterium phage POP12]|nr:hypothetical protein POP12_246 [Pectobacterium phage POP12]